MPTRTLLTLVLAAACGTASAAEPFAPPGARARLSVEYLYESSGKKHSEGLYDPYEWRVERLASLTAELAAQAPTAMPTVQAIDAAQLAQLSAKPAKARAVADKMAPMMAGAEAIMAKCGDNEACIAREAQKMGAAMQGTPQMDVALSAKRDMQELGQPGAPRYQAWRATAQRGTYSIDEQVRVSVPDPICASKPRHRCTREEVRKGGGEIPAVMDVGPGGRKSPVAGLSAVELDAAKGTLTVGLPAPLGRLPYIETITTDEPAGTHDTPTPKGPRDKALVYRVSAVGSGFQAPTFTLALRGGWRSQAGEQVVRLKGDFGNGGTLTVRWRFEAK